MLPILIPRSDIDDVAWDAIIQRSQQCVIYGYSWYLDIVCEDWNAIVWPSSKDLQIVMPLPVRRKLAVKTLYQPLFCQYLGIFSESDLTVEIVAQFLDACCKAFSYISSYHFHPTNFELIQMCEPMFSKILFQKKHTYWLSLNKSFEGIQRDYSRDRWLNVKRGNKFGWVIEENNDLETMITLFQMHHERKIAGGVDPDSYQVLAKLTEKLSERECVKLWYATKDQTAHAGAMLIGERGMAIYLFNAADEVGRKQNARTYLLNHYFETMANTVTRFDFESPAIESISNFYKSFGGQIKPFFCLSKNDLPFPLGKIQEFRKKWFLKTR